MGLSGHLFDLRRMNVDCSIDADRNLLFGVLALQADLIDSRQFIEELLQLSFRDYVHPDFRQLASERFKARMRGEPVPSRYETRLVTNEGKDLWVDFAAASIEYEGKSAILAFGIDITQRKEMEEALRASRAEVVQLRSQLQQNELARKQN
jgi:PAS domain-containing protein